MKSDISILGIKVDLGCYDRGADYGPEAIRQAGLIKRLEYNGLNVEDFGDLNTKMVKYLNSNDNVGLNISVAAKEFERLANEIKYFCTNTKFPLIMGGDHSISIATIAGISSLYKNLGVIWFDAHADLNTPETSPSGSIFGMSLAVNLGYGYKDFLKIGYPGPKVKHENIVLVGTRELDPGESEFLNTHGIKVYSMDDIYRVGIENTILEVLHHLERTCEGIHLSFDMDALDPVYVPGVRTPCERGVSLSNAIFAMEIMGRSKLLTSVEFVELNPNLDVNQQTAKNLVKLAEALF